MYFLLNLSHYVKRYGHFLSNFGIFYDALSPNMVMSRDPRSKFQNSFIFSNSAFNIRKGTKFLGVKLSASEVISQNATGEGGGGGGRVKEQMKQ